MTTEVKMTALPACDFCKHPSVPAADKAPAEYDFKTSPWSAGGGAWAYGCPKHWEQFRNQPSLGTGIGQRLILDTADKEG